MDKWLKDILPDKDPYHNRGRDQMRKKWSSEFECLCLIVLARRNQKFSKNDREMKYKKFQK